MSTIIKNYTSCDCAEAICDWIEIFSEKLRQLSFAIKQKNKGGGGSFSVQLISMETFQTNPTNFRFVGEVKNK